MLTYFIVAAVFFVAGFATHKHRADIKAKALQEKQDLIARIREGL